MGICDDFGSKNPVLRFLNYLLEDYGDEWGTKFMFHYRWYDDKDIDNAGTLLPLYANSTLTNDELSHKKEKIEDHKISFKIPEVY